MSELDDRIPDVLARIDLDLDDLVRRNGGREARRTGGRVLYHCPGPGHDDYHPSFDTYQPTGAGPRRWACRSVCGRSGDAIELLVWLTGCTTAEAIERLAGEVGLERPAQHDVRAPQAPARDLLVRWCAGRGWGPWTVDALGLSLVRDGHGKRRVRFPYRLDGHGVPYHQDRALDPRDRVKWLSPTGGKPILYEADRLRLARMRGSVLVVEGVTDVAALVDVYTNPAVVGVPGAGAWRSHWAEVFRDLTVLVITDDDDAGCDLRERLDADLTPTAAVVHHVFVPDNHNDVADWRAGLEPDQFDQQFMDAVQAATGYRSRRGIA